MKSNKNRKEHQDIEVKVSSRERGTRHDKH